MRIPYELKIRQFRVRLRLVILAVSLILLILGVGLALYRTDTTMILKTQGGQIIETIGLTSQLKGNTSKTLGPIPAFQGNWFGVSASSNKSMSLQIRSNATGTVYNSTQTEFHSIVLLYNSTDYYVSAVNSKGATAYITGNVTLVVLASAETPVQQTKRPFLLPGAALSIFGGITLLYTALPRDSTKRRSYERLFP